MKESNHNSRSQYPPIQTEETASQGKPSAISKLFRRNNKSPNQQASLADTQNLAATDSLDQTVNSSAIIDQALEPSRSGLINKIANVFKGTFNLDDELFEELEEVLISCDIGVSASLTLVDRLRERVSREKIPDAAGVLRGLRKEISESLQIAQQEWVTYGNPYVILMVGVNGVGKTTTTAKIANYFKQQGKTVMLAAADTFRAAAVEQLQAWGQRLDLSVITQGHGADAAAVAHDALNSAKARNVDILIIDTAGRLHTQTDLMEQLQKVRRVLSKIDSTAPHDVMQVLDAGTGQNALLQLEHFKKSVGVSSICLTKLDGSAKGGVAVALTDKFKLPIRFIGVGESFDHLKEFNASRYAAGLISDVHSN